MKGLIFPYEGPTDVQGVCMCAQSLGNLTQSAVNLSLFLRTPFPLSPVPSPPPPPLSFIHILSSTLLPVLSFPSTGIMDYLLELKGKGEDIAEDPVINLTEENFDNIITSSEIILVDFYADW